MKRSIMVGVLFSAALAVAASAQSTAGQTASQSGSSEQVTVTGCLQRGNAGGASGTSGAGSTGAGATGAPGSGGSRGGFVLTNAKMGSASPSAGTSASSTGTVGSPTGSSPSSIAAGTIRFKLEGSQADLQKYANSHVEVSGKLDKGSASSATGSATTGATGAAGPTGSGAAATGSAPDSQDMPTLRMSSVRQVSPTCSGS